jgi:lipooligosaccharide transport system permease protein
LLYKRTWRGTVFTSVLNPVLLLAAMGLGLGSLVNQHAGQTSLGTDSYIAFVGPGLMAAAAMQMGAAESMYPLMAAIKWLRIFDGMLASPLEVPDLVLGHLGWAAIRLVVGATVFTVALVVFGAAESVLVVLAIPAAVLCGLAFTSTIAAFTATQQNDIGFSVVFRLGVMPLFLFSGTFFPVSQLPSGLRPVAYVTPLWHGVELCRSLSLGRGSVAADLGHAVVLVAFVVAGVGLADRTFQARLAS